MKPAGLLFGLGALFAALLTGGCSSLQPTRPEGETSTARAQIERRLQEVFAAAEAKDFDRLDSYHLYGPKFTKFSGASPARLDAAAGQKGERDGLNSINGLKMQANDLKIDLFDEVGIATFVLAYSFESGGETVQRKERSTLVFVREDGDWKIAHEHLSPVIER